MFKGNLFKKASNLEAVFQIDHTYSMISMILNTYWTRPRPISKIIMLARSIVGDAEGGGPPGGVLNPDFP